MFIDYFTHACNLQIIKNFILNYWDIPNLLRKKGKLPYKTISKEYAKEYGTDTLEMHEDAIKEGDNVLIVDDLIATGGTVLAMVKMAENLGGNIVVTSFLIELEELDGRNKIEKYPVNVLIKY